MMCSVHIVLQHSKTKCCCLLQLYTMLSRLTNSMQVTNICKTSILNIKYTHIKFILKMFLYS